jgi:hypothetical protein
LEFLAMTRIIPRRQAIREAARGFPKEKPDPTPVEGITARERPLTLREEMQRFIRNEASQYAQEHGQDSFDEFDDFSIDDAEPDLTSPYTLADVEDESPDSLDGEPTDEDLAAQPVDEGSAGAGEQPRAPGTQPAPTPGAGD